MLRRERLGHGERFSTIVRIHRVIHYICNCVIVSGHFMQRHTASELQGSDFLDAAAIEKADSQGLSEPAHPCHHSILSSFTFQTEERLFFVCFTLVLVCLHLHCLVILVWIT